MIQYTPAEVAGAIRDEIETTLTACNRLAVTSTIEEDMINGGIKATEPALSGEQFFYVVTSTHQRFRVSVDRA